MLNIAVVLGDAAHGGDDQSRVTLDECVPGRLVAADQRVEAGAVGQSRLLDTDHESALEKSFPLSSMTMKAGKSTTSMRQIASMPSSGYSRSSTFLTQSSARPAPGPPIDRR